MYLIKTSSSNHKEIGELTYINISSIAKFPHSGKFCEKKNYPYIRNKTKNLVKYERTY